MSIEQFFDRDQKVTQCIKDNKLKIQFRKSKGTKKC